MGPFECLKLCVQACIGQPVSVVCAAVRLGQADVDDVSMAEVVPAACRFRPGFTVAFVDGPIGLFTHGSGALHFGFGKRGCVQGWDRKCRWGFN